MDYRPENSTAVPDAQPPIGTIFLHFGTAHKIKFIIFYFAADKFYWLIVNRVDGSWILKLFVAIWK